jgi:hypothetical protein
MVRATDGDKALAAPPALSLPAILLQPHDPACPD